MSNQQLEGKTALITGAGSGIGAAMAARFVSEGAAVAVVDVDKDAAHQTTESINIQGGRAVAFVTDISDLEAVKTTVNEVTKALGPITTLVNNAGIAHIGTASSTQPEDLDRIYNVNIKGIYHCLHTVLPQMQKNGGGVVLNMASVASKLGIPDRFAYSMSKGAVLSMTLSVACDYLSDNIRCNCLCPGRVHTPFVDNYLKRTYPGKEEEMFAKLAATQPIGRMGTPDEIARLAAFLCSDEAGFMTGGAYDIDGGFVSLKP